MIQRAIEKPLDAAGRWLASKGIGADQVTFAGLAFGVSSAIGISLGCFMIGLSLFLLSRLADGLDGAVARATTQTDRGGFLDITLDFFVYGAVPVAFAVYDPPRNALSAAILLASYLANGGAFLAFSILAARKGLTSSLHGHKSIYYLGGIAEGAETIIVYVIFCIVPAAFQMLAFAFAAVCMVSAVARLTLGWKMLA